MRNVSIFEKYQPHLGPHCDADEIERKTCFYINSFARAAYLVGASSAITGPSKAFVAAFT